MSEIENVLPDDHFISEYINHATGRTDAYPEYHFSNALTLLSVSANRKVKIMVEPEALYTNYWSLIIGLSTIDRKTTALNIARDILEKAELYHKVLPEDSTPEALVDELSDNPQSLFMKDEFGEFLTNKQRSYQRGIGELLCDLYGCPRSRTRNLRSETTTIRNAYITLVAACVPSQISRYTDVEDLTSGFYPRINIIWPDYDRELEPRGILTEEEEEEVEELSGWINWLYYFIAQHEDEIRVYPTEEALDVFNEWCQGWENHIRTSDGGSDLAPFLGRVEDTVLKIAALLEIGKNELVDRDEVSNISGISSVSEVSEVSTDPSTNPKNRAKTANSLSLLSDLEISRETMEWAIYYGNELYLPNAKKLMEYVQGHHKNNQMQRIYELAKRHSDDDGKIQHSVLLRNSHVKADELKGYIDTLVESDMMRVKEIDGGMYYVPLDPDDGTAEAPTVEVPT